MRALLDTHAFLWFVFGDPRLSATAKSLIADPANERFLSVASAWEIAIKVSIGKLTIKEPVQIFLPEQLSRAGIGLLPIELAHVARVAGLPFHHRDPFDRLIAAQSLEEGLALVSADTIYDSYGVSRIW